MAQITVGDNTVNVHGELPAVGSAAPAFTLVGSDFGEVSLADYAGRRVLLNIFLSVDTGVCAASIRRFNEAAANSDVAVLCISADLPFAQARFCGAEGIENVDAVSTFRSSSFGTDYGLTMVDGSLAGLLARAVVIIDENGNVGYTELVPVLGQEPDYDAALAVL